MADIRRIPDADALAGYVVKYITKSTNDAVWANQQTASEYVMSIKGVRTCATLGSWRGLRLTEPQPGPDDWTHVGTLDDVLRDANHRQPYAIAITLSLRPPADDRKTHAHNQAARSRRPQPDREGH